ncbi:MAG TPA: DUF5050 domain-containing protein, partial [Firmicutes bacterium]|nr:DUF5050 domain-containing protein [Bacillota bacterium]
GGPVKFINMDEQFVYYIRADEGGKIFKVGHDRENRETINLPSDHYAICLNIADDWIYYIDRGSEREQLYRIAVEGGYPELVGGDGDES